MMTVAAIMLLLSAALAYVEGPPQCQTSEPA